MKYFSVTHGMKNFGHCSFNKTNNFNTPNLASGAFSENAISPINEKVYGFNISDIRANLTFCNSQRMGFGKFAYSGYYFSTVIWHLYVPLKFEMLFRLIICSSLLKGDIPF